MKKSILWVGGIIFLGVLVALLLIFRKPTYEVSFISDGTEILESLKVKEDGTIEEPKVPVKEGYDFVGWYSGTEKFDFSTKISEDITLEARWVKEGVKTYTLTFNTNGGSNVSSIKVEEDTPVANLPMPKKEGYTFVGWFDGSKEVTSTTKITKDITLVAKWKEVEDKETTTVKSTKKKTTSKKTTTTTTATTKKKDVVAYDLVKFGNSDEGQGILYLTKNGQRVSGTCTIVTSTNEVVDNVKVDASGFRIDIKFVKEVKNIKVN